ncbi:MAG: DUF3782 domain-containing protein [Magnetococcales bacterium]|nr:DUF3782 domain-containing protein [Magnetococcales bacterium]
MSHAVLTIDDVWSLFRETDRMIQELARRQEETDRQMRVTDRQIKDIGRQIGNLGGRWGEFVEGFIAPACETLFAERGIPVHRVSTRVKARSLDGTHHMEIDLLVDNTDSIVFGEVKSRLTMEDVRHHLERMVAFKRDYLTNPAIRVMGVVAGINVDDRALALAIREGLFVLVQSGENVKFANEPDFSPRIL